MDTSLEGDLNMDEASKYIKISFLCTQQMPKLRPSMSTVVKMLEGEVDVDENMISKPEVISSSSSDKSASHGAMTFSSIYDRSTS